MKSCKVYRFNKTFGALAVSAIYLKVEETIRRYNNMDKQEMIKVGTLIFSWDKLLCRIIKNCIIGLAIMVYEPLYHAYHMVSVHVLFF